MEYLQKLIKILVKGPRYYINKNETSFLTLISAREAIAHAMVDLSPAVLM